MWNEYNHCSAGPCGKGNVTECADWPSHMVWVQYTLGQPVQNGYNHPFSRCWLARVDWVIVKSGGPCGTGSSTEGAAITCITQCFPWWATAGVLTELQWVATSNGLIYVGDRLLVPRAGDLRENLYRLAHDNLGHFSADKSYAALRDAYYWPNMRWDLEAT